MLDHHKHRPLCVSGFLLTTGSTVSLMLGALVIVAMFGRGRQLLELMSDLLPGLEPTWAGFFLALVWGFFLGGIIGTFFVWLYNKML